MADLYIKDVATAQSLNLTDKVPLSQGSTDPVTASIGQIVDMAHLVAVTAGEEISGSRVTRVLAGLAMVADSTNQAHAGKVVGVAMNAAAMDDQVQIKTGGVFADPALNLTPDQPVYFDALGRLTNAVPVTGFIQRIGTALSSTTVQISIDTPIML